MTDAIEQIRLERKRQVEKEGWSHEHDDSHDNCQLAMAAAAYASPTQLYSKEELYVGRISFVDAWPFEGESLDGKGGKTRRQQLIVAAALIVAEIDRLDRLCEVEGDQR